MMESTHVALVAENRILSLFRPLQLTQNNSMKHSCFKGRTRGSKSALGRSAQSLTGLAVPSVPTFGTATVQSDTPASSEAQAITRVEYVTRQMGNVHTAEYWLKGACASFTSCMSCTPLSMMPRTLEYLPISWPVFSILFLSCS